MFEYTKTVYFIGFSAACCDRMKPLSPEYIELICTDAVCDDSLEKADFIAADLPHERYDDLIAKLKAHQKPLSNLVLCLPRENIAAYDAHEFLDIWYPNPTAEEAEFYFKKLLRSIEETHLLAEYDEVLHTMANGTDDMIWVKDIKGSHRFFNQSFLNALPAAKDGHRKTREECLNRGHLFLWELSPDDYKEGEYICMESEYDVINANKTLTFDEILKVSSGELRNLITKKSPVHDKKGTIVGTIGIAKDVTQELRYKEQLKKSAYTDALTRLYNRRYMYAYIKKNADEPFVLLFMDFDNFKHINDNYGHVKGDCVLALTGKLLRENLKDFTVGRIGGDEFIAVGLKTENIEAFVEKLQKIIENAYRKDECLRELGISIGFSINDPKKKDIDTLIQKADHNMYTRKMRDKDKAK